MTDPNVTVNMMQPTGKSIGHDAIEANRRAAAGRALAEAATRRLVQAPPGGPAEVDGRGGLEPVRYGDWEVKGLASDF